MGNRENRPGETDGRKTANMPLEDRALKAAALFMGKELLPMLGIRGVIKRSAPTEQVYLNMKDALEDFNYEMEDGTWVHLEFESDRIAKEDLRRFRVYEAFISYHYGVEVTTYVICSSEVQNPLDTLTEGINTYRVELVRMKDHNADETIKALEVKQKEGGLEREELLKLLLTPLMAGEMRQRERIERSLAMVKGERERIGEPELLQMQAVLYTLASKFLTVAELKKVKEVMGMTLLGEMLVQDGIEIGRENGIRALVESLTGFHIPKNKIIGELMEKFEMTMEQAEEYYKKYAGPQH